MIDARIVASGGEAMVFDAGLAEAPTREWFDPAWWVGKGALDAGAGGRGGVAFLESPVGACVLKSLLRGFKG